MRSEGGKSRSLYFLQLTLLYPRITLLLLANGHEISCTFDTARCSKPSTGIADARDGDTSSLHDFSWFTAVARFVLRYRWNMGREVDERLYTRRHPCFTFGAYTKALVSSDSG